MLNYLKAGIVKILSCSRAIYNNIIIGVFWTCAHSQGGIKGAILHASRWNCKQWQWKWKENGWSN